MKFTTSLKTESGCPSRATEWELPDSLFRFIEARLQILNEDIRAELVNNKAKHLKRNMQDMPEDFQKVFMENFKDILA
jgi:hypothetical protein